MKQSPKRAVKPTATKAQSAAERMRRYRQRRRAAGLRAVTRWTSAAPGWSDHRINEAKSLALHVLAARRVSADPALLVRAQKTVERWLSRSARKPAALLEWKALLDRPLPEVLARATELSEEGARLRQSSPLATLLSDAERERMHDAFRA